MGLGGQEGTGSGKLSWGEETGIRQGWGPGLGYP